MANIATTDYVLFGERAEEFYELISKKEPTALCDLRDKCEISQDVYCRGEIIEYFYDGDMRIDLTTETAWHACDELFELIGEKFDLSVSWRETEVGNEIFITHDEGEYFPEEVYVAACGKFIAVEGYYDSVDEAINLWCDEMNILRDPTITVDYINDYHYSIDDDWFQIYYVKFV